PNSRAMRPASRMVPGPKMIRVAVANSKFMTILMPDVEPRRRGGGRRDKRRNSGTHELVFISFLSFRVPSSIFSVSASPRLNKISLRRAAVNFHFGVFVQGAVGAALGIEADVTGARAVGLDDLAPVTFKILAVLADAHAR